MFHSFPSLSMAFHPFLPFLLFSTGCPGVLPVLWRGPKVVVGEGMCCKGYKGCSVSLRLCVLI